MFEKRIKTIIDKICPNSLNDYDFALLNNEKWFKIYNINTELRLSHFLSQIIHETMFLTRVVENLNYSSEGLIKTWPKRFNSTIANQCNKQPQKIANIVYANRLGNTEPNDGWMYRGRGLLQITGKGMYQHIFKLMKSVDNIFPNIVKDPTEVLNKNYVLGIACCLWDIKKCNKYADKNNVKLVSKMINGGLIGIDERVALYNRIKDIK